MLRGKEVPTVDVRVGGRPFMHATTLGTLSLLRPMSCQFARQLTPRSNGGVHDVDRDGHGMKFLAEVSHLNFLAHGNLLWLHVGKEGGAAARRHCQ